ncbi:MAG: UbiD family decarboxylase [Bacteroidota bacterium]|nr:UbiD family decarboxylase [Bacteroidota bacterium]
MAKREIYHSLQQFLRMLEKEGELLRITAPVDPHLEAAEIAVRSMREGGKALLFENITGSKYPLAMNILSSDRRVELAVGEDPNELGERLLHVAEELMPPKPGKIVQLLRPLASRLLGARSSMRISAPSQQSISPGKLSDLPILQTWPDDGGKFITLPQVFTYDPKTGKRNIGMYRMHVYDDTTTGMHWQIQKGGGFHYSVAEEMNKAFEVAVAIGSDPALLLATIAPLPEGLDEALFAGFLRGAPTRMAHGKRISIDVPAEAEFILEGFVPPNERRLEGPFGDHFGHYSHAGMFPVFHIKAITHRENPIFAATVVGKPPMEDKWLGDATQRILGPLARLMHPEVRDIWAYYEAGFHNLLAISTNQRYGKEAMKTGIALVGEGQLSLTKCAVLVGSATNNRNFLEVLRAIRDHFDPHYDFLLLPNVPLDTLDFTSYTMNLGSKMILDATAKLSSSSSGGNYPLRRESEFYAQTGLSFRNPNELDMRIRQYKLIEDTLLVVQVEGAYTSSENAAKYGEGEIRPSTPTIGHQVIEKLIARENIHFLPRGTKIVAAVSMDINLESIQEIIWGIFTRFDAARDVTFTSMQLNGIAPNYQGIMGIDATWKIGYPNPCLMYEDISKRVSDRWSEYGF